MPNPSKFDKINAAEVLRLQKTGVDVPRPVRAAARRILANQPQSGDSDVVKNYRGIKKSGASKIRGELGKVKGVIDPALHVEQSVENFVNVTARGGNPIAAGARLVQTIGTEVQTFLKQKVVKNVAEAVGKRLFGFTFNGTLHWGGAQKLGEAMLAIRRTAGKAAAVAGPVGFAAELGWRLGSIVNSRIEAAMKRDAAQGVSSDVARSNLIDRGAFGLQARQLRQNAMMTLNPVDQLLEKLGFDAGGTDEQTKRIKQRGENIVNARRLTHALGHDATTALASYAKRHGKTVDELTDRETAAVLDELNKHDFDPKHHADDPRVKTRIALMSFAQKLDYYVFHNFQEQRAINEKIYEEEVLPKELSGIEIRIEDRRRSAERQRDQLFDTPQKWQMFHRMTETANANWEAQRSRRKQVEYD